MQSISVTSRTEIGKTVKADPWRVYAWSFAFCFGGVLLACAVIWWLGVPIAGSRSAFIKDWAQGYTAIVTLLVGLPIGFASSVALVMLAKATVEATNEGPRLERASRARSCVIEIYEAYRPLVDALNALEEELSKWALAARALQTSNPDSLSDDDLFLPLSGQQIEAATSALRVSVDVVCRAFEQTSSNPLVRSGMEDRCVVPPRLLLKSELKSEASQLEAVLSFPFFSRSKITARCFTSLEPRLRCLLNITERTSPDGVSIDDWTIRMGAHLAIAGIAHLEIEAESFISEQGPGVDDGLLWQQTTFTAPEGMVSAAFLHDVIQLIPGSEEVANAVSHVAEAHGYHVAPDVVNASANIYTPRKFLRPTLLECAARFADMHTDLRTKTPSTRSDSIGPAEDFQTFPSGRGRGFIKP